MHEQHAMLDQPADVHMCVYDMSYHPGRVHRRIPTRQDHRHSRRRVGRRTRDHYNRSRVHSQVESAEDRER